MKPLFAGAIMAAIVTVTTSCGRPEPPTAADQVEDIGVFDFLSSLDYGAVSASFATRDVPTSIRRTSEERTDDGRVIGRLVAVYRPAGTDANFERTVDVRDGVFTEGFLSFLARDTARVQTEVTVSNFVPALPAFAAARTREQFRYVMLEDTTIGSERAHRVYVEAVESPDRQPLRGATIAAAKSDSAVLFVRIDRLFASLFYDETSRVEAVMRRDEALTLRPARLYVSSRIDVPFRAPRTFVALDEYGVR